MRSTIRSSSAGRKASSQRVDRPLHRVVHPQHEQEVDDRIVLGVAPRVTAMRLLAGNGAALAELSERRVVDQVANARRAVVVVMVIQVVAIGRLHRAIERVGQKAPVCGRQVELAHVDGERLSAM
jgi:hypothetical protein